MARPLREIAAPFVVAGPTGARVRARLHMSERDAEILGALGRYLGSIAGADGKGVPGRDQRIADRELPTPPCGPRQLHPLA